MFNVIELSMINFSLLFQHFTEHIIYYMIAFKKVRVSNNFSYDKNETMNVVCKRIRMYTGSPTCGEFKKMVQIYGRPMTTVYSVVKSQK